MAQSIGDHSARGRFLGSVRVADHEIEALLGGNAVEFYDLDAEKLAPLAARIGPEKQTFQNPRQDV